MTHPIETRYLARPRGGAAGIAVDQIEVWSSRFERRPKSWYRVSRHGDYNDPFGWRTVFKRPPGFLSQEEALQDLAAKVEQSKLIAADNADRALRFCTAVNSCIASQRVTLVTPTEDSKP